MIKDLVNRVKQEIEDEKSERTTTQEGLLQLLEETCLKLGQTNLVKGTNHIN